MVQEVSVNVKKGVETKSYEGVSNYVHSCDDVNYNSYHYVNLDGLNSWGSKTPL